MKNPFKKISKKTVLIASTLVVLIAIPVSIYFLTRDQGDVKSWYSSSWMYRRAITVSNPGGTLTDEDVLITVDTATLISAGKLQADCDDLRFVDSDDSLLSYWIEAGCNSSTTQIWARVPNIPTGGKNIYLYYGNPAATVGSTSWSGNFLMLANAACPSEWIRETTFDNKFLMIASSYGINGGSNTHNHGTISLVTTTNPDAIPSGFPAGTDDNKLAYSHSHTYKVSSNNSSTIPPYKRAVICYKNNLDNLTSNLLAIQLNTSNADWTSFAGFDNYYLSGYSSYGATGGDSTHTHTTTGGQDTEALTTYGTADLWARTPDLAASLYTHQHTTLSGTTGAANLDPSYMATRLLSPNSTTTRAFQGVAILVSSIPPYGWSNNSSYDDRLLKGGSSLSTGGTASHRHQVSIYASAASLNTTKIYKKSIMGDSASVASHSHTASGFSEYASSFPEYRTAVLVERKISLATSIAEYPSGEEISNASPTAPTALFTEGTTNPSGVGDITPEFSAIFNDPDSGDTAIYYEIEVNTTSAFNGTVMWDSNKTAMSAVNQGARIADKSYAGTTLSTNGTTYYWRIRLWDNSDTVSPWSATAQFTMNSTPTAPTALLTEGATNPTKVTDLTPEFSAIYNDPDTGDTAIYYEIEVNTTPAFNGTVMWDSNKTAMSAVANGARIADLSYAGTTLSLNGATYYWRIRLWDNSDTVSPWSATAQFTMSSPPNAPVELTVDGYLTPTYQIFSLYPSFRAKHTDINTDSAVFYEIEVNSNSVFTGTVMWDTGKQSMTSTPNNSVCPNITYAGTMLSNSSNTYFWRIRFWDTDDTVSPWSAVGSFVDHLTNIQLEGLGLEGLGIN
ncbi:MAG: DUF2341 domain-containing protein [Candidatus Dojkabacteria bacterium]